MILIGESPFISGNRLTILMLCGVAVLISLIVASGNMVLAFGLVAGLFFLRIILAGSWPVLMIWLIGMPTVFVFLNNQLLGIQFLKVERGLCLVLVMMTLLLGACKRTMRIKMDNVEQTYAALLILFSISMLFATTGKSMANLIKYDISFLLDGYLMPLLAYAFVRRSAWNQQRLRWFFYLLAVSGVYQAIAAVLQLYAGVSAFYPQYTGVLHLAEERATGVFSGAGELGVVAATFLLMLIAMTANARTQMTKMLLTLLVLAVLVAVILCKTRAAWLGLMVSLIFVYIHDVRSRPLMKVFGVVGILAASVIMPLALDMDKLGHRFMDPVPIFNRLAAWGTAVNMAAQNPLGVGFTRYGFGEAKDAYFVSVGPVSSLWAAELSVPHNEFINILALTGLPGLILFVLLVATLYKQTMRIWKSDSLTVECRTMALYISAALIGGIIVNGFFVDLGKYIYFYTQIFSLAGLATVVAGLPESQLKPAAGL